MRVVDTHQDYPVKSHKPADGNSFFALQRLLDVLAFERDSISRQSASIDDRPSPLAARPSSRGYPVPMHEVRKEINEHGNERIKKQQGSDPSPTLPDYTL